MSLQDVQNRADSRNLAINKVGIKNLRYPIVVKDRDHQIQNTAATISLYANLPHHFKGTHMSRFIEVFQRHSRRISMRNFLSILEEIKLVLDADSAFGSIEFPYFIEKKAPVTQQLGMMQYLCSFEGEVGIASSQFFVTVEVPVLTLCPCSKEISSRGAHNQRSFCKVRLQTGKDFFWIEDIITAVESCASSGLYSVLKREDERYVTEYSYDHPVFVEDLVREVTLKIEAMNLFPWFMVEAENEESIHLHNAYACIERGSKTK